MGENKAFGSARINDIPWTRKYSPKSQKEVKGQDAVLKQLNAFLLKYTTQSKKGLILYGKHGIGKTSSIYACARDQELEVLEVNASDFRNKAKIDSIIGGAVMQRSLFAKGKVILVDEIDGLSGNSDRGGVSALAKLIGKAAYPIVMTANDPYEKKFKDLRKACDMLQMNSPSYLDVAEVLNKIVKTENIKTDNSIVKMLARRAGGDIRAAINDLQSAASQGSLTKEDVESLSEREHKESLIDSLTRVLKTTDPFVAKQALASCDQRWDTFMLWLDENLPKEYTKPEDLARAYDNLSRADIFSGRIRRRQHYRFLVYINDLISSGVATSKDEKYKGFTKMDRPKRLLTMYIAKMRFAKRNSIAEKVSVINHSSTNACLRHTLPYLKHIARSSDFASQLEIKYDLSGDEIEWLRTH